MKNKPFVNNAFVALLSASLCLVSCAKSEKDPAEEPTTPAIELGEFSYTPGTAASVNADSSVYFPAFNNIVSYKSGATQVIDIYLSALSVGTYTISSATGISLSYTTGSTVYTAKSGTVGITANTGSKLSGKFGVALTGGTLTSLSGSFTDIPKR